jgi:hypothetical protein
MATGIFFKCFEGIAALALIIKVFTTSEVELCGNLVGKQVCVCVCVFRAFAFGN